MPNRRGIAAALVVALLAALAGTAVLAPAAQALPGDGRVLVVGDSLEELTSPYLQHFLPGVPITVNAVGGSNSFQILDLFEQSYEPDDSVVVFDAGTNDDPEYPQILQENLAKVAGTVGERCIVVPTIHGFTVNGVDNAGKNRVVAEFAASRPGTQTPDWAGFVHTHPGLMQSDGLHPIEAGAQARAELIAEGISRCLAGEPNAPVASGANAGAIPPGQTGRNGEAEGQLSPSHESFEPAAAQRSEGPEPGSQPIAEPVHFKLVDRVATRRQEMLGAATGRLGVGAVLLALTGALLH
jgi:lysophospholipase L1-like esterase